MNFTADVDLLVHVIFVVFVLIIKFLLLKQMVSQRGRVVM